MHLVEIEINASSTAFFTSHPDTLTWNNQFYAPVPMRIGEEEIASDMSLPRLYVDVSNYAGQAYQFAKDNDLSLNDVTIRLVNLSLTSSGEDARVKLQIIGSAFNNDAGRFSRSEEHTSELQSQSNLVCRLLLAKKTSRLPSSMSLLIKHCRQAFGSTCSRS